MRCLVGHQPYATEITCVTQALVVAPIGGRANIGLNWFQPAACTQHGIPIDDVTFSMSEYAG